MMHARPTRRSAIRARRGGHLVAEALIIIPILVFLSIAVVEIGLIVSLKQSVAHAAVRAAREGSKGATINDIDMIVEDALSGFELTLASNVGYKIEDPAANINFDRGAITCDAPPSPLSNGNLRVTVCASSSGSLVSGLIIAFSGPDLTNEICTNSAVSKKECPFPIMVP